MSTAEPPTVPSTETEGKHQYGFPRNVNHLTTHVFLSGPYHYSLTITSAFQNSPNLPLTTTSKLINQIPLLYHLANVPEHASQTLSINHILPNQIKDKKRTEILPKYNKIISNKIRAFRERDALPGRHVVFYFSRTLSRLGFVRRRPYGSFPSPPNMLTM